MCCPKQGISKVAAQHEQRASSGSDNSIQSCRRGCRSQCHLLLSVQPYNEALPQNIQRFDGAPEPCCIFLHGGKFIVLSRMAQMGTGAPVTVQHVTGKSPVYPGVPTLDLGRLSFEALQYPKSVILTRGLGDASSRVFSSLMSLFTTPIL